MATRQIGLTALAFAGLAAISVLLWTHWPPGAAVEPTAELREAAAADERAAPAAWQGRSTRPAETRSQRWQSLLPGSIR